MGNYDSSTSWDMRFLKIAKEISNWSWDISTHVGAVIVDNNNRIISTGYNGFPKGSDNNYDISRDEKLEKTIHAEMNALLYAKESVQSYTLYVYPMLPCIRCATHIIQAGIKRVVSIETDNPRWIESIEKSKKLFKEFGVEVEEYSSGLLRSL